MMTDKSVVGLLTKVKRFAWQGAVFGCVVAGLITPQSLRAQAVLPPMPVSPAVDANGVDLANWSYSFEIAPISVGPKGQDDVQVSISLPTERDSFSSNMRIYDPTWQDSTRVTASLGSKTWTVMGGSVTSDPGAQFWMNYEIPTIVDTDGTIIEYDNPNPYQTSEMNLCAAKVTKTNGEILLITTKPPHLVAGPSQSFQIGGIRLSMSILFLMPLSGLR
jgi:hypothetical protein